MIERANVIILTDRETFIRGVIEFEKRSIFLRVSPKFENRMLRVKNILIEYDCRKAYPLPEK